MFIPESRFNESQHSPLVFLADASEMGFPVGYWPNEFETERGVAKFSDITDHGTRVYTVEGDHARFLVFND